MLAEAFLYATAQTEPTLRRLGLVGDAVALWSRATRRRTAWRPHEERARRLVGEVAEAVPRRRIAVVLGSGLLRDVPLDLLLSRFERVVLVDAVHLLPARIGSRHPRAERRVLDLTGVANWLAGAVAGREDPLASLKADGRVDLVVSANCLSQLPRAPVRAAERGRASRLPADLPGRILRWHLDDLAAFRCPVCLLTDVSFREIARDGSTVEETGVLPGTTLPRPDEGWDWEVAPPGEIDREHAFVHQVRVWRDINGRAR